MMKTALLLPLCAGPFFLLPVVGAQTPQIPSTTTTVDQNTAPGYTFVYRAERQLSWVSVAGNFNGWNKDANPLQVDADGLTWRGQLPLSLGKYLYKFVLNGTDWVNDPATETEADADGNANSLLTLTAQGNSSLISLVNTPGNADKVVVLTPDKIRVNATPQTFVYRASKRLKSVHLAGEFNGWNKDATPMQVDNDGITWRVGVSLDHGSHQYKFVINGVNWILDPQAARRFTEASGNVNSVLLVSPPGYEKATTPSDGQTTSSGLLHQQQVPYLNYDRGQLAVALRTRANDLRAVRLRVGTKTFPLSLVKSDELYSTYRTQFAWDGKSNLAYSFELVDGRKVKTFGVNGLMVSSAPFQINAKTFKPFQVPGWVEKTVFYQIFPDRFENGDKSNDPAKLDAWNSTPTGNSHFGGDIAGVKQHLPYLKALGISGVYFNPVFKSPSNHRYDTEDYKQIDPQLGTNAEFAALTREMKSQGIRTVMDFVFNHSATNFAPFQNVRKNGATSPYRDWYLIKSFPVRVQNPPNYVGWWGYAAMPKLNVMNPATGEYLLDLVNYWKREVPLAGLRLDAADEVDIRFWRQLRSRVKSLDLQTWIVGERWSDASPWLQGDQWDASMNYPFLFANVDFFADGKTSASQFSQRLMELYNAYPPQVSRNQMNLLSSHDTPRFLTLCHNDARLHQLAATVQFTWVGAPSIYYGEELGMEGGSDPDNRRGMGWDKANPRNSMLTFYKRLIATRNRSRALQSGTPSILLANDATKTIAYSRTFGNDVAIVALNRSNQPQTITIDLSKNPTLNQVRAGGFTDALKGKTIPSSNSAVLKLELSSLSSMILLPRENRAR